MSNNGQMMAGGGRETKPQEAEATANARQAKMLLSDTYVPLMKLLLTRPHTVSELVEALGSTMNRVFYLLRQLEGAGLVQVASTHKQHGRVVKHYRMSAERYLVPFEVTDADTVQEFMLGPIMARQEAFRTRIGRILLREGGGQGVGFETGLIDGEYGFGFYGIEEDGGRIPIVSVWRPVRLTPKRGRELAARMQALLQEYDGPDGKLCTVAFQMVAEED